MKVKDILKKLEGADPDMDLRIDLGQNGYALLGHVEFPKPYEKRFIALRARGQK